MSSTAFVLKAGTTSCGWRRTSECGWDSWGGIDSHPCRERHFSKVRCHHTSDLSPQLRPLLAKDCIFSPLPDKPTQGCHEPTIPSVTNFIPKAFHPLPKTGVAADAPSHPAGSCWGRTTRRRTTLPTARRSRRSRMFRYGAGPGSAVLPLPWVPPCRHWRGSPLHLSSLSAAGSLLLSGPCARICRLSSEHQHLRRAQVGSVAPGALWLAG